MNVVVDADLLRLAFVAESRPHKDMLRCINDKVGDLPGFGLAVDWRGIKERYRECVGNIELYQKWWQNLEAKQLIAQIHGELSDEQRLRLKPDGCEESDAELYAKVAYWSDHLLVSERPAFGKSSRGRLLPPCDLYDYLCGDLDLMVLAANELSDELKNVNLVLKSLGRNPKELAKLLDENPDAAIEYLSKNESAVALLDEKHRGNLFGYLFELKVREYLDKEGFRTKHREPIPDGDIDVWAEKDNHIFVIECQWRFDPEGGVDSKKVEQVIKALKYVKNQERYAGRHVTGWIASTTSKFHDEGQWDAIRNSGYEIELHYFELKGKTWTQVRGGAMTALQVDKWFTREYLITPLANTVTTN